MQESFQGAHEEIVLVEPSYLEMFIDKILQAMPFWPWLNPIRTICIEIPTLNVLG